MLTEYATENLSEAFPIRQESLQPVKWDDVRVDHQVNISVIRLSECNESQGHVCCPKNFSEIC